MSELIDKLLSEGWYLDKVTFNGQDKYYLVPNDERKGWGAIWEGVKYKNMTVLVPSYAKEIRRSK